MLRARSRVNGDAGGQQLWVAADEKLRDRGDADDHVASTKDHRPLEESGEQTVDDLQSLADEIGDRRERAELKQAETKFRHHYRKENRGNAVLEMIERMTSADQTQGQSFLPHCCFESRRVSGGGNCRSDGGCFVTHYDLLPRLS